MRAGLLTEQIDIIESVLTVNDFGEETEEWVTKYSTRARLVHNGGNRLLVNNEVTYSNIKTFQVRYYVPVDDFDRIRWEGKVYRILNIEPNKAQQNKTIKTELVND
jgi:SPP1 family predicted phage head-tail adaptor